MQLERIGELGFEGSTESTPLYDHLCALSGSLDGDPFEGSCSQSLGVSPLSFERNARALAICAALCGAVIVAMDVAFISSLAATHLEVPPSEHWTDSWGVADEVSAEEQSFARIVASLDEEPIEDGIMHRVEAVLAAHVEKFGSDRFLSRVAALSAPARAASLLRLLGRSEKIGPEIRKSLVAWGLGSASVEVRDAAVQAVENWEDASLVELLEEHCEKVAWLATYAANVARDLGG